METVREILPWQGMKQSRAAVALDRIAARLVELEAKLAPYDMLVAACAELETQLKSAEPAREGAWVRCEERMPEPGDRVVVSYFYGLAIGL